MKLLVASLIACFALSANAAEKKNEIKFIEAGKMHTLDVGDMYGTALAVGRITPFGMKVELVGFTVPDKFMVANPKRLVKAALDISPVDGTPEAAEAAGVMLDFFFSTKIGIGHEECEDSGPPLVGGDCGGKEFPIAKIVTVVYSAADVTRSYSGCMGLDFEIAAVPAEISKYCYAVRPKFIVKHNL